jgi:hypothetical protein
METGPQFGRRMKNNSIHTFAGMTALGCLSHYTDVIAALKLFML